jgi:PAS domain S-box-containing protein
MGIPPDVLDVDVVQELVNTVGIGVGLYDAEGDYRYVNRAYAEMLETDRSSLLETTVWAVNPELDEASFDAYWDSFQSGETRVADAVHEFEGTRIEVSTVTTHTTVDGTDYHIGTVQDITERKRRERQRQRQTERFEAFYDVITHDIPNHLNVAASRLELARRELADGQNENLDSVESAHQRIEDVLGDMRALVEQGTQVDDVQTVELSQLANECWQSGLPEDHDATLVVEELAIAADRTRLKQLFENLFWNAVDHAGDDVEVRVGTLPDGFYAADDGPGIPEEKREDALSPGYSTARDHAGFGLAIVRGIANAHGWSVEITESSDGGARFEFTGVTVESD